AGPAAPAKYRRASSNANMNIGPSMTRPWSFWRCASTSKSIQTSKRTIRAASCGISRKEARPMESLKDIMPSLLERVQAARAKAERETPMQKQPSAEDLAVYDCPKCRDEGIIFDLERNVGYRCECVERKKLQRIMKSS